MATSQITIDALLRNDEKLYEGDLVHYFRVIFNFAQNLNNPYHNFRHLFHMLWLCYNACQSYADILSPREMRNLLIAALFHDFDHSGKQGNDDLNIEIAIRGLKKHLHPDDKDYFEAICDIIRPTQYPYTSASETLPLLAQILRDADASQAFSTAWIQQVVFGLAKEWGMSPRQVLEMQGPFLSSLSFSTSWARNMFDSKVITEKIAEAKALAELLNGDK
jgi:hypothetical protein